MEHLTTALVFFFGMSLSAQSITVLNGIDDALQYDSTFYEVVAMSDSSIIYSVDLYTGLTGNEYASITITDNSKAIFEYFEEIENTSHDSHSLDKAREKWMRLCNAHDAAILVREMYDSEAIYYNHKPLVVGAALLANEYGYMNNEQYNLELKPLYILPLSVSKVFEIGQCEGSYQGKYILVWEQDGQGEWKIVMDSNY